MVPAPAFIYLATVSVLLQYVSLLHRNVILTPITTYIKSIRKPAIEYENVINNREKTIRGSALSMEIAVCAFNFIRNMIMKEMATITKTKTPKAIFRNTIQICLKPLIEEKPRP